MLIAIFILVLFVMPVAAWAYVDPGSISIFLQVVVAFGVGLLIAFRNYIKTVFVSLKNKLKKIKS